MQQDPLQVVCSWYTWETMTADYVRWVRSYTYRWINGRIVHPLSIEETERRQLLARAMLAFLRRRYWVERLAKSFRSLPDPPDSAA